MKTRAKYSVFVLFVFFVASIGTEPLCAFALLREPNHARIADAAERHDEAAVRDALQSGSDVNAAQVDGMTALHWAVYHDDQQIAVALIKAGADAQAVNRYGVAPLSIACTNGSGAIVELLLNAGADPNTSLQGGETALMTAARTGNITPVKLLIARGADVHAKVRNGQTALMWAAAEGHVEVVSTLIEAGADFRTPLKSGFTPLFFAVREGRSAVLQRLLTADCDVNAVMRTDQSSRFTRGNLRFTPLLMAVENGHFELAEQLLAAGADPDDEPAGYTALHAISWVRKPIRGDGDPSPIGSGKYTSLDMVRILVAAGADINARFKRGKSELGRFTYSGSTPFLLAAQASDVVLMKLLVELGADPTIPTADGTTPLLAATGVGALGDGDESAGTEEEAIAATEFLLKQGADINAVDRNGETAMHGAAYQSRAELVRLLVENGASIDAWNHENRAGWTPLSIAIGYRPGNFRPSPSTIAAIEASMLAAGVTPPDKSKLGAHRRAWTGSSNRDAPWVMKDVEYARVGETALLLDLHMPQNVTDSNLVVWVHGGAERTGSKQDMPLSALVKAGFTVASVDYRLSQETPFPAQVHDVKAAIRYLRARAPHYGYRADRIAIAGRIHPKLPFVICTDYRSWSGDSPHSSDSTRGATDTSSINSAR
jgi:ankyrin repeat protein